MFNTVKGQKRANLILDNVLSTGRAKGSYLFYGPSGVGKFSKALEFAMSLNCTSDGNKPCRQCNSCKKFLALSHPDLVYVFPTPNLKLQPDGFVKESKFLKEYEAYLKNKIESPYKPFFFSVGTQIRIDAVHMLSHRLSMSISEGKYKVCIIEDVHLMNQNAANAFLKILEEPPENCVIILLTEQKESLLPTIISRCKGVPFVKLSWKIIAEILEKNYVSEISEAELYAKIADGDIAKAIRLAKGYGLERREEAKELLLAMANRDDISVSQLATNLGKVSVKNEVQVVLHYLSSFFMDIYKLGNGLPTITNLDYREILENIALKNAGFNQYLPPLVQEIDAMVKINNLNFSILIMALYSQFCGNRISYEGV